MRFTTALIALLVLFPTLGHARYRHHLHQPHSAQVIVCDAYGCRGSIKATITIQRRHKAIRGDYLTGGLIGMARAYNGMTASQIGLHRHSQWCMAFLRYLGVKGPVDDRAISALHLQHVAPQIGSIAVYPHHVGLVTGFDGRYPIIISGNSNGRRVYEGTYPRTPIAYVMP